VIGRHGLEATTTQARVSRVLLVAASVGLVLLASLSAGSGPLVTTTRSMHRADRSMHPTPSAFPSIGPGSLGGGDGSGTHRKASTAGADTASRLTFVVGAIAAVIALAPLLWFAVRGSIRVLASADTRPLGPALEATAPVADALPVQVDALSGQLGLALGDLEGTGDPRRSIIACWLRLEAAAAEGGIERRPYETSGELVRKVLGGRHGGTSALDRLHGLYQRARFSAVPVGNAEVEAARADLERLRRSTGWRLRTAQASEGEIE
jgi:hypothetical protein